MNSYQPPTNSYNSKKLSVINEADGLNGEEVESSNETYMTRSKQGTKKRKKSSNADLYEMFRSIKPNTMDEESFQIQRKSDLSISGVKRKHALTKTTK